MKFIDLTGQKFGRLTVIERAENKGKHTMWKCKCECGKYAIVSGDNLHSNHTRSCGCLSIETTSIRSKTHGKTGTRIHNIWNSMRQRCYDKKMQGF